MVKGEHMQAGSTGRGRTMRVLGAVGVLSVLLLAACGSSDAGSDPGSGAGSGSKGDASTTRPAGSGDDGMGLDGKTFTATGVEGYEPVADSQLTLTFADGNLSANAGCNTMSSAYEVTDDQLTWTGIPMATQMACEPELMAQDTWVTDFLTGGVTATLDGDELTLTADDVTITLEVPAATPLKGTAWTLDSLISNEAASSLPAGIRPPTLKIGKDGAAQVFTGCNNGSTTVEITDATLTFAPIAMTRKMCTDVAEVEAAVTTVLDGETDYVIDGTSLTITNGDQGLVYRAAP